MKTVFHSCFVLNALLASFSHPVMPVFRPDHQNRSVPLGRQGPWCRCGECRRKHESVCSLGPTACQVTQLTTYCICFSMNWSGQKTNGEGTANCNVGQVQPQLSALFLPKQGRTLTSCQEFFLNQRACFPRYLHLLRLSFLPVKREILF